MEHNEETRYTAKAVIPTIRKQGRNVAWLSREVGVSRQYMSDVAHGHVPVRKEFAERVATHLGVPFFVVFDVSDGRENMSTDTSQAEQEARAAA